MMNSLNFGFGNVRSMIMPLLQNKYVLYAMLFISLMNILGYLAVKNFDAIAFFVLVALLTIYFSRNMIIILFICIIMTNFYIGGKGVIAANAAKKEGLKNKKKAANAVDDDNADDDGMEPATNMKDDVKPVVEKKNNMKNKKPVTSTNDDNDDDRDDNKEPNKGMKEPNTNKKPKSGMQNLKPASLNTADSDNDDDDAGDSTIGHSKISASKGNRVDYAETLGQAYDNLQNIIGEDGVQGLTDQTKGLMQQQKVLMTNMKEMEPLLQSAQGFMNQIVGNGGLAGLSKLFDGKLFGSLAPGIADNAKDIEPKKD